MGFDITDKKIKVKFISGLNSKNKIETIRFGIKKPINEIVERIKVIETGPTDVHNRNVELLILNSFKLSLK